MITDRSAWEIGLQDPLGVSMEETDAETVAFPQEDYLQFEVDDTAMDEPEEEAHLPQPNLADYTQSPPARFVAEATNLRTLCDMYHCSSIGDISGVQIGRLKSPSSIVGSTAQTSATIDALLLPHNF